MSIEFTPWPEELAQRYRAKGYWIGEPLSAILGRQRSLCPDATAIVCGERRFSYGELDRQSSALAQQLSHRGLRSGDTALVQLPNVAEFYLVFFALLKMGVVTVNALFSHSRLELLAYAEQIAPRLMIGSAQHVLFGNGDFLTALRERCPMLEHVIIDGDEELGENLQALLKAQVDTAHQLLPTAAGGVAFFQLSGGSTGTPKLIPRTHDDYYYSVRRSVEICRLNAQTRYLCALPAPHNFPLSSPGALGVFCAGGRVVLARDPGPMTCFPLIRQHRVNFTSLVPPAVALWLQAAPQFAGHLASLRVLQVGGAKLSENLARRIPQELGCRLQQVLGMAEGLVNYTDLDDDDERIFTTQGRPMSPDDEVRVVDRQGNPVGSDAAGELITRGPYTFRGYYRSPEYNAAAFDAEGFYRSGDLVQMTRDGYLKVVGREKDQINRGGEKIAAEEIENLLLKHQGIVHAALVSMPDAVMGEKSCAFLVVSDLKLKPLMLRKYLRHLGVADYKLPDRFEFIDQLPVTPVGKIDKQHLRERIQSRLSIQD